MTLKRTLQGLCTEIFQIFHIKNVFRTFTCPKSTIETLEKKFEICSKLTIKTPERLVFLLLTLNK